MKSMTTGKCVVS